MSHNSSENVTSRYIDETTTKHHLTQSSSIGKIAGALCKAQADMGAATKSANNPFYHSKYADVSECLKATLPALNKNGIALVQGSEWDASTKTFFVTTQLIHNSGEWLGSRLFVPITKMDAQGVGAAQTYGRRYLLSAMVGLTQEDDDGNSISLERTKRAGAPQMAQRGASPKTVTASTSKTVQTTKLQPAVSTTVPAQTRKAPPIATHTNKVA